VLADRPDLIEAVGYLRWSEWGRPPEPADPEFWIDATRRESGRTGLPVTWVALDGDTVVGCVGLGEFDIAERRDRSPWVLGMVVRPEFRGLGIGRSLIEALDAYAADLGASAVWVATGGSAVRFYEQCGRSATERLMLSSGGAATILMRQLNGPGSSSDMDARP
jgi:GNAT superfamily N-acetyltransferase